MRFPLFLLGALVFASNAEAGHHKARPKRVLIMVMDQLRADFVDFYNMDRVKALREEGTNFPHAYLGHMASETVVFHNVLTSGLLPKHMGWADEAMRDVDNVLGGGANLMYQTGNFGINETTKIFNHYNYPKLDAYLKGKFPGTKFAVIGEKAYAAVTTAGRSTDIIVGFSGRSFNCDGTGNFFRGPTGIVPTYISQPVCGRYYVDSEPTRTAYGTNTQPPAFLYPDDGRYSPGVIPGHESGDTWVADAAMDIIANENWSGMVLTFGAFDKMAHMWGGDVYYLQMPPGSSHEQVHLRQIAKTLDTQIGRVVDKLRDLGQLEETLIVITADHGSQTNKNFYGVNAAGRGSNNWYYGLSANAGPSVNPSPALAPLLAAGNVKFSFQDTAIRTWLNDDATEADKVNAAQAMSTLPGVIASYYRVGDEYLLYSDDTPTRMSREERRWFEQRATELVNTMAANHASDVVGLLADQTGYGVHGDHGGAQFDVQHVPMIFWANGIRSGDDNERVRAVDILPTVLRALDIEPTAPLDGRAVRLRL